MKLPCSRAHRDTLASLYDIADAEANLGFPSWYLTDACFNVCCTLGHAATTHKNGSAPVLPYSCTFYILRSGQTEEEKEAAKATAQKLEKDIDMLLNEHAVLAQQSARNRRMREVLCRAETLRLLLRRHGKRCFARSFLHGYRDPRRQSQQALQHSDPSW